jgi:hypothetical protein
MKKIIVIGLAMAGLLMLASCAVQQPPTDQKKSTNNDNDGKRDKVPMEYGIFSLHPDSLFYKGKDGLIYSAFGDPGNSCIVITENPSIYPLFANHIPIAVSPELPSAVYMGTKIAPLTLFTEEQVIDMSRKVLLGFNKFDIIKMMSYGTFKSLYDAQQALNMIKNPNGIRVVKTQTNTVLKSTSQESGSSTKW